MHGALDAEGSSQFLQQYPEHAKVFNSGREILRQICRNHEDSLVFEENFVIVG